mmetsp:Transcript_20465/g.53242  ORF Transcript_20465/g.53242 Transcript_20465/m.53242 type:complete len:423 (+) Transcript_20465:367-1635(+)
MDEEAPLLQPVGDLAPPYGARAPDNGDSPSPPRDPRVKRPPPELQITPRGPCEVGIRQCCLPCLAGCACCHGACCAGPTNGEYESTCLFESLRAAAQVGLFNSPPNTALLRLAPEVPMCLPCVPWGARSHWTGRGFCGCCRDDATTITHDDGTVVPARWVFPKGAPDPKALVAASFQNSNGIVLHLHGGAFALMTPRTYTDSVVRIALGAKIHVLSVHYRRAPEFPHPVPGQDCLAAYRWLLTNGADPEKITIGGDSAGGALTVETLLAIRAAGLPAPGGAFLLSPWVDLGDGSSESWFANASHDYLPRTPTYPYFARIYAGPKDLDDVSVLNKDLRGFPPILLEVGAREVLRDQSRAFRERLVAAGVPVTYHEEPGMPHSYQLFSFTGLPGARRSLDRVAAFCRATARRGNPVNGLAAGPA